MLTDVSSGNVLAFLSIFAPFLGASFYNFEHVSHPRASDSFIDSLQFSMRHLVSLFFAFFRNFPVRCWAVIGRGCDIYFRLGDSDLWIDMAISFLLLWNDSHWTHTIDWYDRVQCKLARLSTRSTQKHYFDYCAITDGDWVQWIQFDLLQFGNFSKGARNFYHFVAFVRLEWFKNRILLIFSQLFRSACSYYLIFRSFAQR